MIRHCNTTPPIQFLKLFSLNSLFVCLLAYLCLAGLFLISHVYIHISIDFIALCMYIVNVLLLFYIISRLKTGHFNHSPGRAVKEL